MKGCFYCPLLAPEWSLATPTLSDQVFGAAVVGGALQSLSHLLTQASTMSLAISFSLCSRCLAKSGSGQWRSTTKVCRASSFQKRSSEVAEPFLQRRRRRRQNATATRSAC